jgi:tRNA threonylcarbamoyladenosine biosynthesis protein TsaB
MSRARGSIAFLDCGEVPFERSFANDRKESGAFFAALRQWRGDEPEPDVIAVGTGPGSYAGVRIALATARGLAQAYRAAVVGIPSICALDTSDDDYSVVGDARRGSFFIAHVSARRLNKMPELLDELALRRELDKREGPVFRCEEMRSFEDLRLLFPSASRLARLAAAAPRERAQPLEPIYLRNPHITIPRQRANPVTFA